MVFHANYYLLVRLNFSSYCTILKEKLKSDLQDIHLITPYIYGGLFADQDI